MKKDIKYTLEQGGVNTEKYLSLRISKDDLPDDAEVILMVKDSDGQTRPIGHARQRAAIAMTSQFYNKIMADGYIFSPYSHRRYIAVQFKRLLKRYGFTGIENGVIQSYSWDYAIDILRKEVHKLKSLQKHDKDAFKERSRFFTLDACGAILADYVDAVCRHIDDCVPRRPLDDFCVSGYGVVKRGNIRPMKYRFTRLVDKARDCQTYAEMDDLLSGFKWLKLPNKTKLTIAFAKPFVEAGAYYTLKHDMMFEGLRMHGKNQQESLSELRNRRRDYLGLASWLL